MAYRRRYTKKKTIRRMTFKRRYNRRPKKTGKKVQRIAKQTHRYNKRQYGERIGMMLLPNTKIVRADKLNMLEIDPFTLTNARVIGDYLIGNMVNLTQLDFWKAQYIYATLLYFEVTFYIAQTDNLVQLKSQGGSLDFYAQVQTTDPAAEPGIYIGHMNSGTMQNAYNAIGVTTTEIIAAIRASQHFGKLNQRNKVVRRWFCPKEYYNSMSPLSAFTITSDINSVVTGLPASYCPHGYNLFWPEAPNYAIAAGRTKVTLGYKINTVWKLRDRQPYASSA